MCTPKVLARKQHFERSHNTTSFHGRPNLYSTADAIILSLDNNSLQHPNYLYNRKFESLYTYTTIHIHHELVGTMSARINHTNTKYTPLPEKKMRKPKQQSYKMIFQYFTNNNPNKFKQTNKKNRS